MNGINCNSALFSCQRPKKITLRATSGGVSHETREVFYEDTDSSHANVADKNTKTLDKYRASTMTSFDYELDKAGRLYSAVQVCEALAGVGFWDRAQASAAVELRSRLSQGEVAAELDQIVSSIYYDPSVQTRAEIVAKFGNQVRFLDKSE